MHQRIDMAIDAARTNSTTKHLHATILH